MVLGTNPISLGAPANDGDNFVLDMATTATALGKVSGIIRREAVANTVFLVKPYLFVLRVLLKRSEKCHFVYIHLFPTG